MQLLEITSRKNARLCAVRALSERKFRERSGTFFLEGETLFFEALDAGLVPEQVVLSHGASDALRARVLAALEHTDVPCLTVTHDIYCTVSAEHAPQGVLAVFPCRAVTENSRIIHSSVTNSPERYIILEKIQNPGNVGTMLRCAAAFGYTAAVLVDSADLFNPKTVRACMGALFHLRLFVCGTLDEALALTKERGLRLLGTSPHASTPIQAADFSRPFAVLFGNEGAGASEAALAACDEVLTIPMQGMESLNAAAACAVTLYESVRGA